MNSTRHRALLSAFEEDDPLVAGPQSKALLTKIHRFQRKQKQQATRNKEQYDWFSTQRRLNGLEEAITKQILHAGSNAIQLMQKEKDLERLYTLCGVDPTCRADAMQSLQEDLQVLRMPTSSLRTAATTTADTSTSLQELDERYAHLSAEASEHRRTVMASLSGDQHGGNEDLPQALSIALDSLRETLADADSDGAAEIDLLESELRLDLQEARSEHDAGKLQTASQLAAEPQGWDEASRIVFKKALTSISSTTHRDRLLLQRLKRDLPGKSDGEIREYLNHHKATTTSKRKEDAAAREHRKRCDEIEQSGLRKVERLRVKLEERWKKEKASIEAALKSKSMQLRLQALRLERDEVEASEEERRIQAAAEEEGGDLELEAERTERMLEAKQALVQRAQRRLDGEERLQNDFASSISSQRHKHAIRDRTNYRQDLLRGKLKDQEKAEEEALRAEERRLERLNALATTTPYYEAIMDKSADIHKSTQARKMDIYDRPKLADFQSGNLKSFTNDRVFADANFRLGNALHEAGLAKTDYARDVIRVAIPRSEARTTHIKPY